MGRLLIARTLGGHANRFRLVLLFLLLTPSVWAAAPVYIAPNGNDGWSGLLAEPNADQTDGPFASLERARDMIRVMKQQGGGQGRLQVYLRRGTYLRATPFELSAEDSGTEASPIVYHAYNHEPVRLFGGRLLSGFQPISDPAARERIDAANRDKILELDLKSLGITEYGTLTPRGFGRSSVSAGLELFCDGKPMTLARWPNEDWTKIASVAGDGQQGKFSYEGDRPTRWKDTSDLWMHGYWTWDWADSFVQVASVDTASREITTAQPHGVYGYKAGARFYFLNVLEELDAPGEWYLDRSAGKLYFWPPTVLDGTEVAVSLLEGPMLSMKEVSYVTIQDIDFECGRGGGAVISGGGHNIITESAFRDFGTFAVRVDGGTSHAITHCEMAQLGDGAISMSGGDRLTLTPGGHVAANNHIHDYGRTVRTMTPAVSAAGVGHRIAHNVMHHAPHMGVYLNTNDTVVEYNEMHHILLETHDAGAFYIGRDFSERGNVVQYNYFHDLGAGDVQAVYLDDCASGTRVFGNVCVGVKRGVLLGGGRDNAIENNVFVDCGCGVHIDQRGTGWASFWFDGRDPTLMDRLRAVNAAQPPYSERYPPLATLLNDEPALAKGNRVVKNICAGGPLLELSDGLTESTPYLTIQDNCTQAEPGFIDRRKGDFRLRTDAPGLMMGFRAIPMEEIGIERDTLKPHRMRRSAP